MSPQPKHLIHSIHLHLHDIITFLQIDAYETYVFAHERTENTLASVNVCTQQQQPIESKNVTSRATANFSTSEVLLKTYRLPANTTTTKHIIWECNTVTSSSHWQFGESPAKKNLMILLCFIAKHNFSIIDNQLSIRNTVLSTFIWYDVSTNNEIISIRYLKKRMRNKNTCFIL